MVTQEASKIWDRAQGDRIGEELSGIVLHYHTKCARRLRHRVPVSYIIRTDHPGTFNGNGIDPDGRVWMA